jgi:tetratricopeptide (TPR) repeat protein
MLFNIGQCHERLQDYDSAIQAYRSYLDASPGAEDRQAVQHKIEMLDEKMAKTGILLDVSVDGAVVYVDGVEVATSPVEGLLATSPGVHTLEVMREGYQPFTMKFTLPPGMSQQASVDLVPLPPPEPEPEPPEPEPLPSWFFWTYGIAGLAAAAAVATGVLALRKADQAARASEDHDRALWIARHDEMRRLSIATDVLIAAAAAAAVVSTVGLFVALDRRGRAREEPARAPSLSAWASPGAAGMSLTFGF